MNFTRLFSAARSLRSIVGIGNIIQHEPPIQQSKLTQALYLSTSSPNQGLMEFFDKKSNWVENEVRVGRSWKLDELRIKSNTDLHKLWFVLLKEKNMLLTMEYECKRSVRLFPNPERIDKVEESMKNLETVVRERNVAYHELEAGISGERTTEVMHNEFGLEVDYTTSEHLIPKFMNTKWAKAHIHSHGGHAVRKFLRLYKEKLYNDKRKARNRDFNHVQHLLKRFPKMDLEKLKAEYPDVDIAKAQRSKKARGHFDPIY